VLLFVSRHGISKFSANSRLARRQSVWRVHINGHWHVFLSRNLRMGFHVSFHVRVEPYTERYQEPSTNRRILIGSYMDSVHFFVFFVSFSVFFVVFNVMFKQNIPVPLPMGFGTESESCNGSNWLTRQGWSEEFWRLTPQPN